LEATRKHIGNMLDDWKGLLDYWIIGYIVRWKLTGHTKETLWKHFVEP